MVELFEILVCVLAVFGGYTILRSIKMYLRYPRKVRACLRGAVILGTDDKICAVARYAAYLRAEQKISSERLIIFVRDDIMKDSEVLSEIGDVLPIYKTNSDSKELNDDK